jgi:4-hydroxy-tetrahydrodipicolinate synthase
MGKCDDELRLPLAPMSEANRNKLAGIMKEYNLI